MRPAPALAAPGAGRPAQRDFCRTTGRLVLVSHNWSGVLQINNIGRKYTVDLYSDHAAGAARRRQRDHGRRHRARRHRRRRAGLPEMPASHRRPYRRPRRLVPLPRSRRRFRSGPRRRPGGGCVPRREAGEKLELRVVSALAPRSCRGRARRSAARRRGGGGRASARRNALLAAAVEGLALRAARPMSRTAMPLPLSLVIVTVDRADSLDRTLTSLHQIRYRISRPSSSTAPRPISRR